MCTYHFNTVQQLSRACDHIAEILRIKKKTNIIDLIYRDMTVQINVYLFLSGRNL